MGTVIMEQTPSTPEGEQQVAQDRMALLVAWDAAAKQLAGVKAIVEAERALRKKVAEAFFPQAKEGTNSFKLPEDYVLKLTYPIDRKVDPGALQALKEKFVEANISADKLVEYKPSLVVAEYRTLTAEEQHLFDQALIVKPGSISMEIVLPAKAKKAKGAA